MKLESTHQQRRRVLHSLCAAGTALLFPSLSRGDAPAGRPMRLVVPFTPGTGIDLIARTVGPRLGERLDLAPAGGHDREFGTNKECVAEQQHHKPENSCPVAHAAPTCPAGWFPPWTRTGLKQIRSTRRPSMRVTLSVPPPTSTVSPTAAIRPSWLMT